MNVLKLFNIASFVFFLPYCHKHKAEQPATSSVAGLADSIAKMLDGAICKPTLGSGPRLHFIKLSRVLSGEGATQIVKHYQVQKNDTKLELSIKSKNSPAATFLVTQNGAYLKAKHNKAAVDYECKKLSTYSASQFVDGKSCGNAYVLGTKGQTPKSFIICDHFPARGSKTRNEMVQAARDALNQGGEGWLAIDTRPFFAKGAISELYQRIPDEGICRFMGNNIDTHLSSQDASQLQAFVEYMQDVLAEAVGCEMDLHLAEIRKQNSKIGVRMPEWHVDGGDFAILLALKGTSTEILRNTPRMSSFYSEDPTWDEINKRTDTTRVPSLCSLIITGDRSTNLGPVPTVHRTPLDIEDRLLLVVRLSRKIILP